MICVQKRHEAMVVWQHYESLTSTLAQELCEQLRMVLAPTLAAKFKYVSHKYHPVFKHSSCLSMVDFSNSMNLRIITLGLEA